MTDILRECSWCDFTVLDTTGNERSVEEIREHVVFVHPDEIVED